MTGRRVVAVSVGAVQQLPWHGRVVESGIRKSATSDPVAVGPLGLAGDQQADRRYHGGVDKAVLAYPYEHYHAWAGELDHLDIPAFGENLTTTGLLESDTVLGSVFDVGTTTLQVTTPRRPCYKLAAAHGVDDLAVMTQANGRTGMYLRVLTPGFVRAGDSIVPRHRPAHGITAAEVHRILNIDHDDHDGVRRLLRNPEVLPSRWVALLENRLAGRRENQNSRLGGEEINERFDHHEQN